MTFNTEQELREGTELVLTHVVFDGLNGMGKPHKLIRFENDRGGSMWLVSPGTDEQLPIVEFGEIAFVRDTGDLHADWEWAETEPSGIGRVERIDSITAVERLVEISNKPDVPVSEVR